MIISHAYTVYKVYKHTLESDSSASPEPPVGSGWDRIRGEGSDTLADVIRGGIENASRFIPGDRFC